MFETMFAMFCQASLFGMKAVRFCGSGPAAMFAVSRAPAAAVKLRGTRVAEMFWGRVRKLSMTWMTPPVKLLFYFASASVPPRGRQSYSLSDS